MKKRREQNKEEKRRKERNRKEKKRKETLAKEMANETPESPAPTTTTAIKK